LAIGAVGIAAGLMLFGPKIIQVVGEKITKLNRTRAFCVALSAAITVIIASGLGLPVSSTHIAVGAVFGVGFLREFIQNRRRSKSAQALPVGADATVVPDKSADRERKARKRLLVRRRHLSTIVAAWIITVPASAILSGMLFYSLNALFY
jgi:PiT family inorganic phosphate transporter